MYFFFRFFKNEENLKKNTSTSGCIEKYISLVKMYKKIRNRKIELKKKIIINTNWQEINAISIIIIEVMFLR